MLPDAVLLQEDPFQYASKHGESKKHEASRLNQKAFMSFWRLTLLLAARRAWQPLPKDGISKDP